MKYGCLSYGQLGHLETLQRNTNHHSHLANDSKGDPADGELFAEQTLPVPLSSTYSLPYAVESCASCNFFSRIKHARYERNVCVLVEAFG